MKPVYKKYFTAVALIWSGCFVLFLLTYMLAMAPQKKVKRRVEQELAKKEQVYDSALKAAREETKAKLNEQIEHLRNRLGDFVIDFEDSANLTFDISRIAKNRNITPSSITSKESSGGSALSKCNYICEHHISIDFAAGFNEFAAFLNALERHRPVIFVDGFRITRSEQGSLSHPVDMSLAVFVGKQQEI